MKDEIIDNISKPKNLEHLYQRNKETFHKEFLLLYKNDNKKSDLIQAWIERLEYKSSNLPQKNLSEMIFIIISTFFALSILKLGTILKLSSNFQYLAKNFSFSVIPILIAYISYKKRNNFKFTILISLIVFLSIIYQNSLNGFTDTIKLACLYMPFFMISLLGITFVGEDYKNILNRIKFLKFLADLIITAIIILACGIFMTIISFALFKSINVKIDDFFIDYVVVWGISGSFIVSSYLVMNVPDFASKISPIIARIFTPLFTLVFAVYLGYLMYGDLELHKERNELILLNIISIIVLALIIFSISENFQKRDIIVSTNIVFLLILSLLTVLINIALISAISYRITEWGFTPNRIVVIGGNIIMLIHIAILSISLIKILFFSRDNNDIYYIIGRYLPIYSFWTAIIIFFFPILFNFK